MTSREVIPANRDSSKAGAAHGSELESRADEIRAIAAKPSCKTINDLSRLTGFNMETARHWNVELGLNLPDARLRTGPRTEAKANPKQPKKQGGK